MVKVNLKFWNKGFSEEDISVVLEDYPQKNDLILYNNKWYRVKSRGFDLDTGKYTKVHCNQETDN